MLQVIADAGLYLTLTKRIAQHPEHEREYVSHTLSLRLVLFILVFSIGCGISFFLPSLHAALPLLLITTAGLLFQSLSQLFMGVYQQYQLVWRATLGDLLGRGIQIAVIGGVVWYHPVTLTVAALAFAISCVGSFSVHFLLLPLRSFRLFSFQWTTWKVLLAQSWPLGLLLVINMIYFRIDTLLLSFFRSSYEVGLYSLAYRLMESALFFPAMFGGLLLPRLTESIAKAPSQARQWLEEALSLMACASVFIVIVGSLKASELVTLFGEAFTPAAPLFAILSVALASIFWGTIFGFALVALEKQTGMLILYGVLAVFNIVANLLFIPRFGATAAASITVLTELGATMTAGVMVYRHIPFHLAPGFILRVVVAAGSTGVLLLLLPASWPILLQIVIAALVYTALSVLLKTIHPQRMKLLFMRTV